MKPGHDRDTSGDGPVNGADRLRESPQWMRRAVLGYRRADVLAVVTRLADSLDREWCERALLQHELDTVRADLTARLDEERARRIEAEQSARVEGARLLADAQEQAARLRHEASAR